jgi:Domain of unknown function (DUF6378)
MKHNWKCISKEVDEKCVGCGISYFQAAIFGLLDEECDMSKSHGTIKISEKKKPIDGLLSERGKTHGDYVKDAGVAIQFLLVVEREFTTAHSSTMRHSIIMIIFKLARILTGDPDFADHWRDIAGYATLIADKCGK